MGLLDSFTDQFKEAFTFEMPNDTKLAEDGVPIIKSPKKIDTYPIVQDASVIRNQALYLISYYERGAGETRLPENTKRDEALIAKMGRCFEAWRTLNADDYNAFFSSMNFGQVLSQIKPVEYSNGWDVSPEGASYARMLLSHLNLDSAERKERILSELNAHIESDGTACQYLRGASVVMEFFDRVVTSFRNENTEEFAAWQKMIRLDMCLPFSVTRNAQIELCERYYRLLYIPPEGEDRAKFNRALAEHYRAGYGQASRPTEIFKQAKGYLKAEAAKRPSGSTGEVGNCGTCGANVAKADSSCPYCGTQILRGEDGTKTKVSLDLLLPVTFIGSNQIDLPSCTDSLEHIKALRLDGTFDDDLDVLAELVAWYKAKKEKLSTFHQGDELIAELKGFMDGQWTSMARKARRDDGRERDLVRLVTRWRRDCLGETAGLGIGGLFAGADKKKKAFEAKVRDDLGF